MSADGVDRQIKADVFRAIRALAYLLEHIDAYHSVMAALDEDLPHIEANVADIRKLLEERRREAF